MQLIRLFICLTLYLISLSAFADYELTKRKEVQQFIHHMVKQYNFNAQELSEIFKKVKLQPQLIESMDKPYEKKNWTVYKDIFLTSTRLTEGLRYWALHKKTLTKASKKFGVSPEIIVAILGVETLYGERQGDNSVLDALSTLAFNYPKRSAYFTKELAEYLLLCREQNVAATTYKGSYAGAIGMPQFMPSSYRYYAVDFNKKGKRDLVNDNNDSIGSIANYLHKHGWKLNEGIAQPAQILNPHYKNLQINPKTANYTYLQLIKAGVKPVTASVNHPKHAGLIELITADGKEYWMAYPNFFVITRYNSSPQYALVVYLLSQQLKQLWLQANTKNQRAYA